MGELLIVPALLGYGEAVVAYAGELRGPGKAGRAGTWGVRIGWLAQTGLLIAQIADSDGFPWATWAGALNLFVWLVVTAYLIWGCSPRYRLLGLAVMPVAAALLLLAWIGGGTGVAEAGESRIPVAAHAVLILAAFAGFTLAGAMAVLYLWEERRLKRRDSNIIRLRMPPLETLDRVAGRTAAVSLALLTAGMVVGLASLDAGELDLAMGVTVGIWALYAIALILRHESGLRGRRFARVLLAGLLLIAVVLPITHFAS